MRKKKRRRGQASTFNSCFSISPGHQSQMAMPALTDHTDRSTTWMLFESGNGVVVDLSLYSPSSDKTRPIDAYVVTECEGDFTGSARRAAETVYNVVREHDAEIAPVVVGYDLQGLSGSRKVIGESGGLAFAIALAKRVYDQDPGPVAATGEVKSINNGGPVGPIKGIKAKLEAAGRLVPENGWVFYPKENEREIPDELRTSLEGKRLRLQPVSSVAQALDLLFDFPAPQSEKAPVPVRLKTPQPEKELPPVKPKNPLLKNLLVVALVCVSALLVARIHGWTPFGGEVSPPEGNLTQTRLSDEVIEEKNSINNGGKGAVSLTQPVFLPGPRVNIRLSGRSGISSSLAQLTTEKLENLLTKKPSANPQPINITGQVVIRNINEIPSDNEDALTTLMTVAVNGLTFEGGKTTRSLPVLSITVQGQGSIETFLPEAASALAREIANETSLKKESKKKEHTGSGFE